MMVTKVVDEHDGRLLFHVVWGVVRNRILMQVIEHDLVVVYIQIARTVTASSLLRHQVLLFSWLARGEGVIMASTLLLSGLVPVRRDRLVTWASFGCVLLHLLIQTHVEVLSAFLFRCILHARYVRGLRHLLGVAANHRHGVLVAAALRYL